MLRGPKLELIPIADRRTFVGHMRSNEGHLNALLIFPLGLPPFDLSCNPST